MIDENKIVNLKIVKTEKDQSKMTRDGETPTKERLAVLHSMAVARARLFNEVDGQEMERTKDLVSDKEAVYISLVAVKIFNESSNGAATLMGFLK